MNTRRRVWLSERSASLSAARVDREAGVIRGVKVLGLDSVNRRRYLPEAVRGAVSLYEGASVRTNHPRKAADQRGVEEVFGWLEGVEFREDGLYADLHVLNPKTELAESVFLAAEKNPRLFGLSHNCQGDTETGRDGVEVVRQIHEVRSVDLVADPATTGGLFEGRGRMKLKAFLEAIKLPGKRPKAKRKLLVRLFEAGAMDAEMEAPMDAPPAEEAPEADHVAALTSGFEAALHALVKQVLSGEMDEGEAKKKFGELCKQHGKLTGRGDGGEEMEEEKDEDLEEEKDEDLEECDDEKGYKKEAILYRREKKGRLLCEAAGVTPDSVLLEALGRAPDEKAMKRLIEREKGRPAPARSAPRSGSGGGGKAPTPGSEVGEFVSGLRSGR